MISDDSVESRLVLTRAARVSANREIAPGVYALRFPREFDFLPGQVVAVRLERHIPPRYYSIASGVGDSEIELLYDVVPDGMLTPALSRCRPGEELLVSEPFGSFVDCGKAAWWVATGTGVAPFASMARSGACTNRRLLHGARTLEGFYFHDELAAALGPAYVCCCSAERAIWVYPGRLTRWLAEQQRLPAETRYMLCGSAGMVIEVRDLLIAKGVPFGDIIAEIYF